MQPVILRHLRARRAQIRSSWDTLLQIEPVTTPLAEPQVLSYLFESTLDRIFDALKRPATELYPAAFHCPCGLSPFLSYFRTAEQVLLEALVLVHAENASESSADERAQDVTELRSVIRSIGREEMALFGSICQHRQQCLSCGQCPQTATVATVLPISNEDPDAATCGT